MAQGITNEGEKWYAEIAADNIQYVAAGTGSKSYSDNDTSLDNEVLRTDVSKLPAVVFADTSENELVASITIAGGTDVPAGTTIRELALISTDSDFVYRDVLDNPITFDAGLKRTLRFSIDLE